MARERKLEEKRKRKLHTSTLYSFFFSLFLFSKANSQTYISLLASLTFLSPIPDDLRNEDRSFVFRHRFIFCRLQNVLCFLFFSGYMCSYKYDITITKRKIHRMDYYFYLDSNRNWVTLLIWGHITFLFSILVHEHNTEGYIWGYMYNIGYIYRYLHRILLVYLK